MNKQIFFYLLVSSFSLFLFYPKKIQAGITFNYTPTVTVDGKQNQESKKISKKKKETAYEKIFSKKKVKTANGFITLHIVDNELYMEYPLSLLNNDLILSSQIDQISEFGIFNIGQRANRTLFFTISLTDTTVTITKKNGMRTVASNDTENLKYAIEKNNIPPILFRTPISAYSPDSSSVVFKATSFLSGNSEHIINVDPKPKKDKTVLYDVIAYDNSVSILNNMTIDAPMVGSSYVSPITFTLKTTLSTLPTKKAAHRFANNRIGSAVTRISVFDEKEQQVQTKFLANRWRIEPSDTIAYLKGIPVEPQKPLIFYVDTLFTPEVIAGIKSGFEKWNSAFEKIGFKDVIRVYPYPKDSTFDASNNIKYNTIKYVFTEGIKRQITKYFLTDPRTGEILSASLYFTKEMFYPINSDRLINTAAADKQAQTHILPAPLMKETITAMMMKEAGFCLGLTENLAGASAYDVDSLRSSSFTSKNGITASVMDDITYNYLAQPGDLETGVDLVVKDLGAYDEHAIKWLYTPIINKSQESEKEILSSWIKEKQDDPRYTFIPRLTGQLIQDPRSIPGVLGNDIMKSTQYAIDNYKYVFDNYFNWINTPETKESYKQLFPEFIFMDVLAQLRNYAYQLGSIYIHFNEKGEPYYTSLPKAQQKESLNKLLSEIERISWMNNKETFKGSKVHYTDITAPLIATPIVQILNRLPQVALSSNFTDDPYHPEELINDMTSYAVSKIKKRKTMNITERRIIEWIIVSYLNQIGKDLTVNKNNSQQSMSITDLVEDNYNLNSLSKKPLAFSSLNVEISTFEESLYNEFYTSNQIKYFTPPNLTASYYAGLKEIQKALSRKAKRTKDEKEKGFCNYYSYVIKEIFKGKKVIL